MCHCGGREELSEMRNEIVCGERNMVSEREGGAKRKCH